MHLNLQGKGPFPEKGRYIVIIGSELSVSKKIGPSLSEVNDDNNLVEEKISYLSARKEILESLQKCLDDEEGATEEDELEQEI